MGVPSSKEFHARMKSDYSNNDLDVQQKSLNMGIFNNCSCFDTEVNPIILSRKKDLDPIEPKFHLDGLSHSRSLLRPLPQIPSTSETIHITHNAPADTTVSHKKKEAHTLQQCSLESSFRKENKDKVELKNKKRKRKKRKLEGFKTSLNSQKTAIIGDGSELVHSAGYIIHCVTDRRLSKTVCEAGKIDDELVQCDGYIIHCINDKRLQNKDCEAAEGGTRMEILQKREDISIITRLIEGGNSHTDTAHIFDMCVENGNSLCCRYLFKCNQWTCSIRRLIKAVKASIDLSTKTSVSNENNKHIDTAKAIAWQISRRFYISQQKSHKIKNLYPAFKCICKNKSSEEFFCSDLLYIVVVVVNNIHSLPKHYKGIPIYQVTQGMCTEGEGIKQKHEQLLLGQSYSFCLLHGVSSKYAHQLFSDHSNLFSIIPSLIRSKCFKTRNQFTVEKCATFTCGLKGFIPIGERHFPDSVVALDGTIVQTDVIEGAVNLTNLMVGDHIESATMNGTLGGMLLYFNKTSFITCAHVLLDEQTMISRKNNAIHKKDLRVFVKDENGQRIECGNAVRCDFETGSDKKPGIDVAVIQMNAQSTVNPNSMVLDEAKNPHSHLYLGMSNEYLNDNCIDYEILTLLESHEVETMAFGQVTTVEGCKTKFVQEKVTEVELKNLGQAVAVANGNPTFPVMIAQPAHFQMSQGSLPATTTFRMYNQLCLNVPLVPGDSGTCIYIRNCPSSNSQVKCHLSDKNGKCPHSGCLGMAIAFSNGMSFVTPLKTIFEHIL